MRNLLDQARNLGAGDTQICIARPGADLAPVIDGEIDQIKPGLIVEHMLPRPT